MTVQARELQIVFLGNSLTGVNNLPGLFKHLAASQGVHPHVEAYLKFGRTIDVHLADERIQEALRAKPWDLVVVQDFSNLAITDPAALESHVRAVQALVPKSQIIITENWAYRDEPRAAQERYDRVYREVGERTGAQVAYVGEAFSAAKEKVGTKLFLPNDDRHPSALATYLVAMMYLEKIYGVDPGSLTRESSDVQTSEEFWGAAVEPHVIELGSFYGTTEVEAVVHAAIRSRGPTCEGLFVSE